MKIELRPYQNTALDDIRAAFAGRATPRVSHRVGHGGKARSAVLVKPCGAGKTYTFSAIASGAAGKGNRVLILAHRKELIFQASLSLAKLGVVHRVIAPASKVATIRREHVAQLGRPYVSDSASVAVASVQTLTRRLEWLDDYHPALIITDECHHSVSTTYQRIYQRADYAMHLGVTATPCRTDGTGLGQVFETMVMGPSPAELIDMGNLVPPRVFAPPMRGDLGNVHTKGGDYDAKEMADILDRPTITGDAVDHYMRLAPHRPGIVFCCNRQHARHVAEQFQQAGVKAFVIDGTMDDVERDRLIRGMVDGSVELLVSVDIISEGTDIIVAEVAIMLRATQSLAMFIQMSGRVLRPAPGKEYGLILDHVGNVLRHGLPHSDQPWSLEGRKRKKQGPKDPDDEIKVAQCPKCYLTHEPMPVCPGCGHVYEVKMRQGPKQRDGELTEIEESDAERQRREARRAQGQARTKDQLVASGMNDKRADHILRARQEKQRLQAELREMLETWRLRTQRPVAERWGFNVSDVDRMKPKQLRENIQAIGDALFSTIGRANDNRDPEDERQIKMW